MDGSLNRLLLAAFFLGLTAAAGSAIDLDSHSGGEIYRKQCAECHGARGEGSAVDGIDPLVGKRSLESLAGRIERTMPEEDPDLCVGPDARAVAEYVYHAFYSPEARERNSQTETRPGLSRLTAPQYLNSVMDIFGYFRNSQWPAKAAENGLSAVYVPNGRGGVNRSTNRKGAVERIDRRISFDFGGGLPQLPEEKAKAFQPEEFGIAWTGSIYAQHTGVYEFVLRTRNGAYLNINEPDEGRGKLIDAWVASGNEFREERGRIFLIGGRIYPLDLHFFKYKEEKAMIELLWKPPHGKLEVIPAEVLRPERSPRVFVSATPFPADDRSLGYETGVTISRAWMDAVMQGGLEAAAHADEFLDELAQVRRGDSPEDREKKVRAFASEFYHLATRQPHRPDRMPEVVASAFEEAGDDLGRAVRLAVLRTLTSPEFLYPAISETHADLSWRNAGRLALTLWDSLPGKELRMAAGKGELDTPQRLANRARRMLEDSRARAKMDGFFDHWLELDKVGRMAKDRERYPEFDADLVADLRTSLDRFLDEVVWGDKSDYRDLILSDVLYLNPRLARLYGAESAAQPGGFEPVSFSGRSRHGLVTHPLLLASQAYHNNSSPIHRGVFLSRNVAGLPLKPPQEAIEFDDAKFSPDLTMREKVTEMTKAKSCMACHSTINPVGFSLEHFDALGRWRERDGAKPIDDDSVLQLDSGEEVALRGAGDFAAFVADSPLAHRAFISHLFHHLAKQPLEAFGIRAEDRLLDSFRETGFSIRHLLVEMALLSTQSHPQKS